MRAHLPCKTTQIVLFAAALTLGTTSARADESLRVAQRSEELEAGHIVMGADQIHFAPSSVTGTLDAQLCTWAVEQNTQQVTLTAQGACADAVKALAGGKRAATLTFTNGTTADVVSRINKPLTGSEKVEVVVEVAAPAAADAARKQLAPVMPQAAHKRWPARRRSRHPAGWCPPPPELSRRQAERARPYTFCIDASDARQIELVWTDARNHIIQANRSIWVVVLHDADKAVDIELGGTRGLFAGAIDKQDSPGDPLRKTGKVVPELTVSTASFAPRLPGDADITVTLHRASSPDPGKYEEIATRTVEVIVERRYIGAIRTGFGLAMGGAVDRGYGITTAPGSATPEIVQSSGSKVDLELTVGFSAFLEAFSGGRSYGPQRALGSYFLPGLYVGVGALSQTQSGVEGFRSLHIGLEWEPVRSFAIALTAVVRRVTRLRPGLSVGSAVDNDSEITTQGFQVGWGLVFSVSPEFMQFVAPAPGTGETEETP